MDALRIVDPISQSYTLVGHMPQARWYATPAVMPDGNVLIVGGYQQVSHSTTTWGCRRLAYACLQCCHA